MRSTPEIDAKLKARLQEAVNKIANGSADKFGQLIGYANGGYVREVLNNKKPVRETLIERVHARPEMAGWFDDIITPMMIPGQPSDLVLTPDERALVLAFRQQRAAQLADGQPRKRRSGDR